MIVTLSGELSTSIWGRICSQQLKWRMIHPVQVNEGASTQQRWWLLRCDQSGSLWNSPPDRTLGLPSLTMGVAEPSSGVVPKTGWSGQFAVQFGERSDVEASVSPWSWPQLSLAERHHLNLRHMHIKHRDKSAVYINGRQQHRLFNVRKSMYIWLG